MRPQEYSSPKLDFNVINLTRFYGLYLEYLLSVALGVRVDVHSRKQRGGGVGSLCLCLQSLLTSTCCFSLLPLFPPGGQGATVEPAAFIRDEA